MVVIGGLFVIGLGMAMLQVVINPLTRATGGEGHFAFFSVMGQLVFGLASYISPSVFSLLMSDPAAAHQTLVWVKFYQGFLAVFVLLIALTSVLRIPRVELTAEERSGGWAAYRELIGQRPVQLYFVGIIAYVGTEQSLANWMSQFLATYHHYSPTQEGAHAVGLFWGLMSVGCLLGLVLLKLFDAKKVLAAFTVCALVLLGMALYGPAHVALFAFPMLGFFLSVMYSIIFSTALNSVTRNHGAFSGILCTGILGGAIVPLFVGVLGDHLGLRTALLTVFVTLGFILSVSWWARPLVRNQTIDWADLFRRGRATTTSGS
jgi:fucose permease